MRYLTCPSCGLTLLGGGRYSASDDCPKCRDSEGRRAPLRPTETRFSRVDVATTLDYPARLAPDPDGRSGDA